MHTNTRSISPSGSSATSATVRMPSTSSPARLVPNTLPSYPLASRLWSETKPNLPGWVEAPDTSTPRGSKRARNCSSVGRGRTGARGRRRAVGQLDERVHRHRPTVGTDDQRVDVDAGDVVALGREPAEPDQQPRQAVPVDGRLAAERAQQPLGGELVDHLVRRHVVDGRRAEDDIGDGLGEDPTDAEHHRRPELRVAQHARDQLPVSLDHGRDEDGDVAILGRGRGQQLGGGAGHGVGVGEAEAHEPAFGLVGDAVAVELGHDREPELLGRRHRLVRRADDAFTGDRHAALGEEALGLGLGERAAGHRRPTVVRSGCDPRLTPPRRCQSGEARSPRSGDGELGRRRPSVQSSANAAAAERRYARCRDR